VHEESGSESGSDSSNLGPGDTKFIQGKSSKLKLLSFSSRPLL
jgi:hypothetical protein